VNPPPTPVHGVETPKVFEDPYQYKLPVEVRKRESPYNICR